MLSAFFAGTSNLIPTVDENFDRLPSEFRWVLVDYLE